MNLSVTARLTLIKNIVVLALLASISCTWGLWWPERLYPLLPGSHSLAGVPTLGYLIPPAMIISLLGVLIFRRPRFFIIVTLLFAITLLLLDSGRMQYWYYTYVLVLLLLLGYNWRVDDANHYTATFNGIRLFLASIYVFGAVQHFSSAFVQETWMQFIKPFERLCTPEQCSYLGKVAYVVPFVELFIVIGLFMRGTRLPALVFALLFHLFSFVVMMLQSQLQPAALVWHFAMIALVLSAFAGNVRLGSTPGFAFEMFPAFVLSVFGLCGPIYFAQSNLMTRMDLMQCDDTVQYIYLNEEDKEKLPLYVQSFTLLHESGVHKLCVSAWSMHETNTRMQLNQEKLIRLTIVLQDTYGAQSLVALPVAKREIALK